MEHGSFHFILKNMHISEYKDKERHGHTYMIACEPLINSLH